MIDTSTLQYQLVTFMDDGVSCRVLIGRLKSEASLFISRQPQDDHIIGKGGEELARVGDAVHGIAGGGDSAVEVQLTIVILPFAVTLKTKQQAAGCLVGHAVRTTEKGLIDPFVGLPIFFPEDHFLYLLECSGGFGVVVPVGCSAPDRLLVQLNLFLCGISVDHGPQPRVTQRECFLPLRGRGVVP